MNVDEIIERTQWDFFWMPENVEIVDRPEILYVRSTSNLKLFNQVVRTRAPVDRLPALVQEVVRAHEGRSSRWLVPATIRREPLAKELEKAGYAVTYEHFACAIAVDEYRPPLVTGINVRAVDTMERLHDWLEVAARAFGEPHPGGHHDLERQLRECAMPGARVHRVVAYDDATGEPISAGGLSLFPDLRFGFLWAGGTVPEARGRGAYSAVLQARARYARSRDITHVGLYAMTTTSAPIVLRQGFRKYGPMTYWDRPA